MSDKFVVFRIDSELCEMAEQRTAWLRRTAFRKVAEADFTRLLAESETVRAAAALRIPFVIR